MKKLIIFFSLLASIYANAQLAAPALAPNDNWKNCIVKQSDNNFFIGGMFIWNITPFTNTKIAVVNNNITNNFSITNASFSNQSLDEVMAVENYTNYSAPNFYRYVGGDFVNYNGVLVNGFMRISTNGSLDPLFTLNNATNPFNSAKIRSIAIQSDGKIIVGGQFTNYLGATRSRIVRLNENGTLDNTFNNTGSGLNGEVYTIKIQPDGKILVGGNFTGYNGIERNRIARLNSNGSLDTNFGVLSGVDGIVRTMLVESNGSIIIGGDFNNWIASSSPVSKSFPAGKILRLLSNGYHAGTLNGFYKPFTYQGVTSNIAKVTTITQYSIDKIFIGGEFDTFAGVIRKNICLMNSNFTLDSAFNTTLGPDGVVLSSIVESTGNVVIVGGFYRYNGVIKNGITRVAPSGLALRMSNGQENIKLTESLNKEILSDNQNTYVDIYPNPASDHITINSDNLFFDKIFIYSIDGRLVFSEQIGNQNTYELNLNGFSKGIFLVSVQTKDGQTKTQKVIIK